MEILAPAGSIEAFEAAMKSADAVYMAFTSFGARASADNFDLEQFVDCLHQAHILGKKIYLTLNTLIKEREWDIFPFLSVLYKEGLDGVIVQDLGLLPYLQENFPELPIHASTQMNITAASGVNILKEHGVTRIVPARELSMEELAELKKNSGLEVEAFIHGSMCYSYSGQCLFSAHLGGRSGNRGRCAGTCRLPYTVVDKDNNNLNKNIEYPLSLVDMCGINNLKTMQEMGIDSLKIEGRMKNAVYVYGISSIYSKYKKLIENNQDVNITKDELYILNNLYTRTKPETADGLDYFNNYTGPGMISVTPSYNMENYDFSELEREMKSKGKRPVSMKGIFKLEQPAELTIWINDDRYPHQDGPPCQTRMEDSPCKTVCDGGLSGSDRYPHQDGTPCQTRGEVCCKAINKPVSAEQIKEKLGKLGDSLFRAESIEVEADEIFLPVSAINNLRRSGIAALENKLLEPFKRSCGNKESFDYFNKYKPLPEKGQLKDIVISVVNNSQLSALQGRDCSIAVYFDSIYNGDISVESAEYDILILPRIYRSNRERNRKLYDALFKYISTVPEKILMVSNLELLGLVREKGFKNPIMSDYSLYISNKSADVFLRNYCNYVSGSLELSKYQLRDLDDMDMYVNIYGHVPLMVSANCVKKTCGTCDGGLSGSDRYPHQDGTPYQTRVEDSPCKTVCDGGLSGSDRYPHQDGTPYQTRIIDRMGKKHPVVCNCVHCMNIIYNYLPKSNHKQLKDLKKMGFYRFRLDFTIEDYEITKQVIDYYFDIKFDNKVQNEKDFPFEFTAGLLEKGSI